MAKPGSNASRCSGGQSDEAAYHVVEDGTMGRWHEVSGDSCRRGETLAAVRVPIVPHTENELDRGHVRQSKRRMREVGQEG